MSFFKTKGLFVISSLVMAGVLLTTHPSPGHAASKLSIFTRAKEAMFGRSHKATPVAGGLEASAPSLAVRQDELYDKTNGLFSDFSVRVENLKVLETLGRTQETEQVLGALGNPMSRIVILEGREGVGKTQGVVSLVERIQKNKVPPHLSGAKVIEVNLDHSLTRIDDFERYLESTKALLGDNLIYYFPKTHRFIDESSASQLRIDHYLEAIDRVHSLRARAILEGISEQIDQAIKTSSRLSKAPRIEFHPLSEIETERILAAHARSLEAKMPDINFSDEVLEKADELARIYYSDLGRPMGAIHLITSAATLKAARRTSDISPFSNELKERVLALERELAEARQLTGRYARQRTEDIPEELTALKREIEEMDSEHNQLMQTVSRWEQLTQKGQLNRTEAQELIELHSKMKAVSKNDLALQIHYEKKVKLEELIKSKATLTIDEKLKLYQRSVFGQTEAIEAIVHAMERAHSSLRTDNRPLGSFLFLGPTGVGKTEVVLTAGKVESRRVLRKDMSEFKESHAASDLIGSPQGYLGHGSRNFVDDVVEDPRALILLDEIEKAHPAIFDLLLQVLDAGRLTSRTGKLAQFDQTFVAMTSNALTEVPDGLSRREIINLLLETGKFRPEFLNRIEHFIVFRPMNEQVLVSIFERELASLNEMLSKHLIHLDATEALKTRLAQDNLAKNQGSGRDLVREFNHNIKDALDQVLNYGSYKTRDGVSRELRVGKGDLIQADYEEGVGIVFRVSQ